jgi:hypothetical protein
LKAKASSHSATELPRFGNLDLKTIFAFNIMYKSG